MHLVEAIVLAVIQGVTEFLPISSSAHLALAPWLFGWKDQGLTFDISLHFGTLLAVLAFFFKDWLQITAQAFGLPYTPDPNLARNKHLLWWLAAATIPIGIAGLTLKEHAETTLRNPWVIGSMLIGVGLLMFQAERIGRRSKQIHDLTFTDAILIGLSQALAVVPGTSRSGITITTALFRHMDRASAARFSFLLSTPAVAAAAAKAYLDLRKQGGIPEDMLAPFATGIVVSAFTGLLVITFFLKYLRVASLQMFVYYRVGFGILVLALAFFRRPL